MTTLQRETHRVEKAVLIDQRRVDIAELLEAQKANPHRIRAYRNGARQVRESQKELAEIDDILSQLQDEAEEIEVPVGGERYPFAVDHQRLVWTKENADLLYDYLAEVYSATTGRQPARQDGAIGGAVAGWLSLDQGAPGVGGW